MIAQGDHVIPIPGTKRIKYLEENMGALKVKLSEDDVKKIRKAVENQETAGVRRYPAGMADQVFSDTPEL